jgi:hypothetical protein
MSHIKPNQQVPVVERATGLMTRVWYAYMNELAETAHEPISATLAYDPPNLAAGGTTTQAVTVDGATLGWQASATFSLSLGGLMMTAYVSAANTVTVVLFNPTAGAIDLGPGTLTAFAVEP